MEIIKCNHKTLPNLLVFCDVQTLFVYKVTLLQTILKTISIYNKCLKIISRQKNITTTQIVD